MPFGYTGKVLWIDLSNKNHWVENIPDEVYENFLSGIGLAAYILYREIPPPGRSIKLAKHTGLCFRIVDQQRGNVNRPLDGSRQIPPDWYLGRG